MVFVLPFVSFVVVFNGLFLMLAKASRELLNVTPSLSRLNLPYRKECGNVGHQVLLNRRARPAS